MKKCIVILILLVSVFPAVTPPSFAKDEKSIVPEDILSMTLEEMMNVKIQTAGKKEERIADIPASAVIITRKDIETYGYMSLEEILENVPGMYVLDDYGPYRKTYGVRGFYAGYPRNIIFLVNGVSQSDGVFDYNVMSNFNIPVEAIDKIEVVRGPMSVMYGQGAFFGAINIITNDTDDDTSLAAVSYGNLTKKAAAKVTGSQDDFRYSLSAGYSDSDGYDSALSEMVSDMSTLDFWGVNNTNDTTDGRLERDSKNFIFSGNYKKFSADFSYNKSSDEVYAYRPSTTDGAPYDREMVNLALGYETQVTDKVRLNAKASYQHFDFLMDWDIDAVFYTDDDPIISKGASDVYEFEIDAFIHATDNIDITTGLYYKRYHDTSFEVENPMFDLFYDHYTDDDINLWAAFTQINFTLTEKLRLVGGLRVEQMQDYTIIYEDHPGQSTYTRTESTYDRDDVDLVSSLAAIYAFNDKNVVKFLYGEAIARPSFFQNRDQMEDSAYPNLEPEEIQTFELNFITTQFDNITFNVSVFHNILDQLIVRTIQIDANGTATEYNANGGELVTNGAEFSVQARPFDRFFADLSITYQNTEDERAGYENIDVAYSPHLLGYAKLSYKLTDTVTVALTGTYVDEMETEWDETLNNGAGGRIGDPVDDHFLVGANLRLDNLFDTGWYGSVRVSNILDEDYRYPTYVNNTWADKGTLGAPREYLVTVGVKF